MSDQTSASALDRQEALSRVGGDIELLREIAVLFMDECPRALAEMQDAIERGDAVKLESAAHALKGSVGNFGARAAVEAAFRLEQMGRAGELGDAKEVLRGLQTALAALSTELARL